MEARNPDTRCPAVARSGERCKLPVQTGADFCERHDPKFAERRSRAAKKAGRKPSSLSEEAAKIRRDLRSMMAGIKRDEVKHGTAYAYSALAHAFLSAIRVEMAATEHEDLVERIERLEENAEVSL
jgi:hypothetical protein